MKVIMIEIDKLVVDHCNMRRETISISDDFQRSIDLYGVQEPLVVRPSHCSELIPDVNYGIVCGAQRYRAAVVSPRDIEELPCIIREMTDYEARIASIQENYLRNPPEWHEYEAYISKLCIAKKIENPDMDYREVVEELARELGIEEKSAQLYLRISYLPTHIKLLFKKTKFKREREVLRAYGISGSKVVGKGKAELLTILDRDLDLSHADLTKFVRRFLGKNESFWKKAIEMIQNEPNITFDEIERELEGERDKVNIATLIDLDFFEELQSICVKRNKSMPELIKWILKEWVDKWDILTK